MSEDGPIINEWDDVLGLVAGFREGDWMFRGETRSGRPLKSSLERLAVDRWGRPFEHLPKIEQGLIRRFQRESGRYLSSPPARDDWIGWLALMRHHGAPTRLLDWTYSFFIALHFAISEVEPDGFCAVWAANVNWIHERTQGPDGVLPEDTRAEIAQDPNVTAPEMVQSIVRRTPPKPLVYPLNPFSLPERLVLQQGIFLVPGDIRRSFGANIDALGPAGGNLQEIRICASRAFLREATRELVRMNISEATLFPGLDGFSRHLASVIPFEDFRATDDPEDLSG